MARVFNLDEKITSHEDKLPERFFEPLEGGILKGSRIEKQDFEQALKTYYGMMGWSQDGVPGTFKLEELELEWIRKRTFGKTECISES